MHTMKARAGLLAVLLVGACRTTPSTEAFRGTTTIVRMRSALDSAGVEEGLGHLTVVVRPVDEPADALLHATVRLLRVGADSSGYGPREASADMLGVTRFDSLPAGDWRVEASRIGYGRYRIVVRAIAGCRSVAELYLAYSVTCLFDCPATAPRAVVTTCATDD